MRNKNKDFNAKQLSIITILDPNSGAWTHLNQYLQGTFKKEFDRKFPNATKCPTCKGVGVIGGAEAISKVTAKGVLTELGTNVVKEVPSIVTGNSDGTDITKSITALNNQINTILKNLNANKAANIRNLSAAANAKKIKLDIAGLLNARLLSKYGRVEACPTCTVNGVITGTLDLAHPEYSFDFDGITVSGGRAVWMAHYIYHSIKDKLKNWKDNATPEQIKKKTYRLFRINKAEMAKEHFRFYTEGIKKTKNGCNAKIVLNSEEPLKQQDIFLQAPELNRAGSNTEIVQAKKAKEVVLKQFMQLFSKKLYTVGVLIEDYNVQLKDMVLKELVHTGRRSSDDWWKNKSLKFSKKFKKAGGGKVSDWEHQSGTAIRTKLWKHSHLKERIMGQSTRWRKTGGELTLHISARPTKSDKWTQANYAQIFSDWNGKSSWHGKSRQVWSKSTGKSISQIIEDVIADFLFMHGMADNKMKERIDYIKKHIVVFGERYG